MDPTEVRALRVQAERALVGVEDQLKSLAMQAQVLRSTISNLQDLERMLDPDLVQSTNGPSVITQTRPTNVWVRDLLAQFSPEEFTVRRVLDELLAQGWTTESAQPINVIRNTLSDLARSDRAIVRGEDLDGRARYRYVNLEPIPDSA